MGGRIEDTKLQNYINEVGQKLARVSHNRFFDYHYVALNDESINAFALPGGWIFITRGMLEKLQTEAQLAGILGHETVHVVARHSSEAMTYQIGTELLLSAVLSDKTPQGAMVAADLSRQIIGLKYSRDHEKEADIGGMDYMVKAGYTPNAMIETMEILEKQQKIKPVEFLSTHPSPENRAEYLEEEIYMSYANAKKLRIGEDDYQKDILEKLKLLPKNSKD
jgi:predicted Zn-dependent protease